MASKPGPARRRVIWVIDNRRQPRCVATEAPRSTPARYLDRKLRNFHRPEPAALQFALPIVPLEAAEVGLAGRGALQVEQLGGPSILPAFRRGLNQVHFDGIERVAQLFVGGEGVVFLPTAVCSLASASCALSASAAFAFASGLGALVRRLALRLASAGHVFAASIGHVCACQVLTAMPARSKQRQIRRRR